MGVARLLLIFVDGLGLGPADPHVNPLARARTPALGGLLGGAPLVLGAEAAPGVVLAAAATGMGVPGMPQSATGQTALLTGVNAARLEGRHVNAYPTAALKRVLAEFSLFRAAVDGGRAAVYLNAFQPESLGRVAAGTYRATAFTVAALAAGLRLMGIDDVRAGRALYHDLTCASLARAGLDVPLLAPAEAGRVAARQAAAFDLTVFEHFVTDVHGHHGDMAACVAAVEALDAFLGGVVAGVREAAGAGDAAVAGDAARGPGDVTVLLTSDHGNIEDIRTAMHTGNPVPVLAFGPQSGPFAGVRELTDIAPAVAAAIGVPFSAPAGAAGGG